MNLALMSGLVEELDDSKLEAVLGGVEDQGKLPGVDH
jgi:hypothetical protein